MLEVIVGLEVMMEMVAMTVKNDSGLHLLLFTSYALVVFMCA